jgi:SAM-dependent methyltransferase
VCHLVVDAHFAVARLAEIYDVLDSDRGDLEVYAAIVDELGASKVLDIGCGTGSLACLLARRGKDVIGVDPASASVDVARRKGGADRVRWVVGDLSALPPVEVDVAIMTGNVAQVFVADRDWTVALRASRAALRAGGWFVFETRDPAGQAWREWTRASTYRSVEIPGVGGVETWVDLTDVSLPVISFTTTFVFASDGAVLTSDSTLRFRGRAEIISSLHANGFMVEDMRDAPDRPGREMVFLARR